MTLGAEEGTFIVRVVHTLDIVASSLTYPLTIYLEIRIIKSTLQIKKL